MGGALNEVVGDELNECRDTCQAANRTNSRPPGSLGLGGVGVLLSLNFRGRGAPEDRSLNLPVEEVRMLSEVFGRIKSDYVEPVEDKRLIKEAINGMLTGLDPHSAFLDEDAYKEMHQTKWRIGHWVGVEDGFVRVISRLTTHRPIALAKAGDYIIRSMKPVCVVCR